MSEHYSCLAVNAPTTKPGGSDQSPPWVRLAFGVAGLVFFFGLVLHADLQEVGSTLLRLPAFALLALLPFPLSLGADALAWKRLLHQLGERASFARTWAVRFASEAVGNAVPMAGLASETVGPTLLAARTGVPLSKAVASSAAKRWLVARAHATYVLICVALLAAGRGAAVVPVTLCVAVAAGLAALSATTQLVAGKGRPAERVFSLLDRLPLVGGLVAGKKSAFSSVDADLGALARSLTPDAWALVVMAWLFEGTETWLLLRAVGLPVGWTDAIAMDGVLSALRSTAVFVPSGLGVQDAGFAYFLGEQQDSQAAAFLLLKRGKELLYVGLGLGLYFFLQSRNRRPSPRAKGSLS